MTKKAVKVKSTSPGVISKAEPVASWHSGTCNQPKVLVVLCGRLGRLPARHKPSPMVG